MVYGALDDDGWLVTRKRSVDDAAEARARHEYSTKKAIVHMFAHYVGFSFAISFQKHSAIQTPPRKSHQ